MSNPEKFESFAEKESPKFEELKCNNIKPD